MAASYDLSTKNEKGRVVREQKKSNGNDKTGINVKIRDLFFPHAVFMLYDGFN